MRGSQKSATKKARFWPWKRRPSLKESATFLYVWLMVGFATGTFVLVAPVRWITGYTHGRGWSESAEDVVMMGVIGVYVLVSIALALAATRLLFQSRARAFKYALVLGMTTLAGSALWGWTNPAVYATMAGGMNGQDAVATESGAVFLFGPYPDKDRLEQLKAEGVTAVVSLQHPAVMPFEPQGIEDEKAATAELGIRFIQAPMLPWVSDNAASLEVIRKIATEETGRFYIHCGLGRDRVNVVKRMLERMGVTTQGTAQLAKAMGWQERLDAGLPPMERGELQRIGTETWLVPRPNDSELFGNMLAGQAGIVVLLLDPDDAEQRAGLDQMTKLFDQYGIPYWKRPLHADDAATAEKIVQEIRKENTLVTVVAPRTPPRDGAQVAETFLAAWKLGTAIPEPPTQEH